jgi:hypothetical protein
MLLAIGFFIIIIELLVLIHLDQKNEILLTAFLQKKFEAELDKEITKQNEKKENPTV